MALYSEKALLNMTGKGGIPQIKDTSYTGLYYEDPKGDRKYIVIGKQMGNTMRRTTNPKRQERQLTKKKTWWPEEKKVEAATLHVATGSLKRVSELTKVPLKTVERWADEDWWLSTQQRVKREAIEETDAKFSKLINKAVEKLQTAVEEGDYMYDIKRGTLVKVPMTGRDLALVTGVTFDKRQLLRGEATRITKVSDPEKHLAELAKRFAELVSNKEKIIEGEVLDGSTELLPNGTVQEEEDAGNVGSPTETENEADGDYAVSPEAPSSARDQFLSATTGDTDLPNSNEEPEPRIHQRLNEDL